MRAKSGVLLIFLILLLAGGLFGQQTVPNKIALLPLSAKGVEPL